VGEQVMFEGEALFAFTALIWSLRGVEEQVSVQAVLVAKVLSAVRTDMRTLAGMRSSVSREMMLEEESLSTLFASIWSFLTTSRIVLACLCDYRLCILSRFKVLQVSQINILISVVGRWHILILLIVLIRITYDNFNRLQLWRSAHVWFQLQTVLHLRLLFVAVLKRLQHFLHLN
jgi:hypothetical protein